MLNKGPQLSIIILTFNEEKNIKECLESIKSLEADIYIVDSGSTDRTIEIAKQYTSQIYTHPFDNYAAQRNWSFENLPISTEWILNMDADHRLTPELVMELEDKLSNPMDDDIKGLVASRKTIFMGKWIRYGGHYPTYHAIIFRKGYGSCEDRLYDQHFKVDGQVEKLKGDIVDSITESLTTFITRHNKWSDLEALEQYNGSLKNNNGLIEGSLTGNPIQKRRYLKNLYDAFPLFVRPVIYFIVRYFFRLGFLDGTRGLIFHFLQCFWFRFLIDAKIYEKRKHGSPQKHLQIVSGSV